MKIEKIKKTGSKYKIILDSGEIINTFDDVILENNLLFSKNIDTKLLEKIMKDTIYYDAYNKVLKMISKRLRSEFEISEYLKKESIDQIDALKIVDNLKKIGLINDYNFARAYTNDKINLSLDGPCKVARYLENNKICADIIDEMIESYSDDIINERIKKIISKKVKTNKKNTGYVLKQKIISYLINLGYSRESINKHVNLINSNNIDIQKEMEKIYNKLLLKFKGDDLIYKLKNKLYTKGFSNEEIDNFINKKQF